MCDPKICYDMNTGNHFYDSHCPPNCISFWMLHNSQVNTQPSGANPGLNFFFSNVIILV